MPRPRNHNLDNTANTLIDAIVSYIIISEKCAAHLRQYDKAWIARLYEEQQAIFLSDPVKYPSITVAPQDTEGRNKFRALCQALCFPPETQKPCLPQDYIMMYFGAIAGMHLATEEAGEYPHRSDLCAIANERSLQILDDQFDQDPEDDDEIDKARQEIAELIDENISCRDKRSGEIIEYVVVDYINSLIGGDYFVLV